MTPAALTFLALANAWNLAAVVLSDKRSVPCCCMCFVNLLLFVLFSLASTLTPGATP